MTAEIVDGTVSGQTISAVERETGLTKDALRIWERRYGFPRPGRDQFGERVYPPDQVEKLRLLKRLLDFGFRPGKIITFSTGELKDLAQAESARSRPLAGSSSLSLSRYLDLLKSADLSSLRNTLTSDLASLGLARFVIEVVAPLNILVGDSWATGDVAIFEEHFYTVAVTSVIRDGLTALTGPRTGPRVLLTTFPNESHGLGLLMAEAMFALEGCQAIWLGLGTPVDDIVAACESQNAHIVALSFSAGYKVRLAVEGLRSLRAKLPLDREIWAGGSNRVVLRRMVQNVQTMTTLVNIPYTLAAWQKRHANLSSSGKSPH